LIEDNERGLLSIRSFIRDLDDALNIWILEPEYWSDEYLLQWAQLVNTYSKPEYRNVMQLDDPARHSFAEEITELHRRVQTVYNWRQQERMLASIDAYEQGRFSIRTLVTDLEGLYYGLDDPPEDWSDAFFADWGDLETACAVAFERRAGRFSEQDRHIIGEAIAGIRELIRSTNLTSEVDKTVP
jgi:hypothetical protein